MYHLLTDSKRVDPLVTNALVDVQTTRSTFYTSRGADEVKIVMALSQWVANFEVSDIMKSFCGDGLVLSSETFFFRKNQWPERLAFRRFILY